LDPVLFGERLCGDGVVWDLLRVEVGRLVCFIGSFLASPRVAPGGSHTNSSPNTRRGMRRRQPSSRWACVTTDRPDQQ